MADLRKKLARLAARSEPKDPIEAMVDQYDLGVCIDRNEESVRSAVRALLDPPARATSRDLTSLRWDTQAGNLLSFYSELAPADPTPVS